MNSAMTYEISTDDSAATQALAHRLSLFLAGGEVIELTSDLGGGKTTFVQGLAQGLGYSGAVTSPTFTLSNVYELAGGRRLHHYDLYRLGEAGIVGSELMEDIAEPGDITVIEWPGLVEAGLPDDRLTITFEATGENRRLITFKSAGPVSQAIVERLKS